MRPDAQISPQNSPQISPQISPEGFHPTTPYAELSVPELLAWAKRLQQCAAEWGAEVRRLRAVTDAAALSGPTRQALLTLRDDLMTEMAALTAELERRGDELARQVAAR